MSQQELSMIFFQGSLEGSDTSLFSEDISLFYAHYRNLLWKTHYKKKDRQKDKSESSRAVEVRWSCCTCHVCWLLLGSMPRFL